MFNTKPALSRNAFIENGNVICQVNIFNWWKGNVVICIAIDYIWNSEIVVFINLYKTSEEFVWNLQSCILDI